MTFKNEVSKGNVFKIIKDSLNKKTLRRWIEKTFRSLRIKKTNRIISSTRELRSLNQGSLKIIWVGGHKTTRYEKTRRWKTFIKWLKRNWKTIRNLIRRRIIIEKTSQIWILW